MNEQFSGCLKIFTYLFILKDKIMKKFLLTTALSAMIAQPVFAEELHYNIVEFDESASVSVPNDTMNIVLRVQETGKSRNDVSNKVSRRVNAVLAKAKANHAFEVESGNRSVYPEYGEKRTITNWTDSADIRVKSMDFDALSKLAAETQDVAMLENVSFSVSPEKRAAAVEQSSEQALKAFQTRAKSVSNSLGFSSYKIVRVQLNQSFENMDGVMNYSAPMEASLRMAKVQSNDVMNTSPGMQEIRQTVHGSVQMQ